MNEAVTKIIQLQMAINYHRATYGSYPRAISFHPGFVKVLRKSFEALELVEDPDYEDRNEIYGIPYIENPLLETEFLLIKYETL